MAHFVADSEQDCLAELRRLIGFLPLNNLDDPPAYRSADPVGRADAALRTIVPPEPNRPYDVREIIYRIIDDADFMEVQAGYAPNLVVGFGRMAGRTVGLVGNQPAFLAGALDINASAKASRFVRFCDCFNVPLVTLVDVPGFMPGTEQEYGGIIRHGAKLIYAYAEATVPKVAVITRKAYGGAYIVMSSKHLRSDVNLAWPGAEIAVMGPDGAVNIIYREEIAKAADPERRRRELIADYQERFTNPYVAATGGIWTMCWTRRRRGRRSSGRWICYRASGTRCRRKSTAIFPL